jgi:hypothetical protein
VRAGAASAERRDLLALDHAEARGREVKDCLVLEGVPPLTNLVLDALRTSRFTPVHYRGEPRAIQYLFTFNFELP